MLAAHTLIEEVGPVGDAAGVKTLVLNHLLPAINPDHRWLEAQKNFSGRLLVGQTSSTFQWAGNNAVDQVPTWCWPLQRSMKNARFPVHPVLRGGHHDGFADAVDALRSIRLFGQRLIRRACALPETLAGESFVPTASRRARDKNPHIELWSRA